MVAPMNLLHTMYQPAGDGPHPTILALHGWGANAMDLLGLAPYLADGRFQVLCPQGRVEVPLGPMVGYGWFPLTMGGSADAGELERGIDDAWDFLDAAMQRYPIDPKKLVVLGFSQGGVIAYAMALSNPQRFAGLVAMSSWLPAPLVQALPPAIDHQQLPALVHHGSDDDLIEIGRARESVERLRRLQVPVTYREFGMGHQISAESIADLGDWLAEKVLSPIVLLA